MIHLPSISAPPSPDPHPQGMRCDRRLPGRLLVATVAVGLLACESVGPSEYREVAIVAHMDFSETLHRSPQPVIPKTATAGVPLGIVFETVGGGCVRRIGHTKVTVNRESAVVTPYDILKLSPNCYDDGLELVHGATMVFDEPGTKKVILRYSTLPEATENRYPDGQWEHTVEVSR